MLIQKKINALTFFCTKFRQRKLLFLHGVLSWDFVLRGLTQLFEQHTPQIGLVGSMPFPGYEWQFIPEICDEALNEIGRRGEQGQIILMKIN